MHYQLFQKKYPQFFTNENFPFQIVTDPKIIKQWQENERKILKKKKQPLSRADIGIIVDDPYFLLIRDLVIFPNGEMRGYTRLITRAILDNGEGVVVLPMYENKIILLHQFRHATRQWHYEFPRGYGEPDISPQENAIKEIHEEISSSVEKSDLIDLGKFYNNTGFEGHPVSLFFATLASIGEPNKNEGIKDIIFLSPEELSDWIRDGKITDGFTIAAYTLAKFRGLI